VDSKAQSWLCSEFNHLSVALFCVNVVWCVPSKMANGLRATPPTLKAAHVQQCRRLCSNATTHGVDVYLLTVQVTPTDSGQAMLHPPCGQHRTVTPTTSVLATTHTLAAASCRHRSRYSSSGATSASGIAHAPRSVLQAQLPSLDVSRKFLLSLAGH
jgi:hypothetical protein